MNGHLGTALGARSAGGRFVEVSPVGGLPTTSLGGLSPTVSPGLVGGSGPVRGLIEHADPCP